MHYVFIIKHNLLPTYSLVSENLINQWEFKQLHRWRRNTSHFLSSSNIFLYFNQFDSTNGRIIYHRHVRYACQNIFTFFKISINEISEIILFFLPRTRLEKTKREREKINAFKKFKQHPSSQRAFTSIRSLSKLDHLQKQTAHSIVRSPQQQNPPKFHPKSTHQQRVPTPSISKEDYNYLTVPFKHITDPQQSVHNPAIFPRLLRLAETFLLLFLLPFVHHRDPNQSERHRACCRASFPRDDFNIGANSGQIR